MWLTVSTAAAASLKPSPQTRVTLLKSSGERLPITHFLSFLQCFYPQQCWYSTLGSCEEHVLSHPWGHCEGGGCLVGCICSQTQQVLQGISEFPTSLCSLSNLDSVHSGNHSLKPKEKSVKLYYPYNQFEIWFALLFSLCEPWAQIFSVCQYVYPLYSHPHVPSFDLFLSSPLL